IPIVYGKHVRDWFFVDGEKGVSNGSVPWTGDNKRATQVGARIRVYLTTWQNPKPGKKVMSIDYIAFKDKTVAAPFCVAMTAEAKEPENEKRKRRGDGPSTPLPRGSINVSNAAVMPLAAGAVGAPPLP